MDASLHRRAPRRNRKPLKRLLSEMSRVVGEVRGRVESPRDPRVSADDFAQMLVCGLVAALLDREHLLPAGAWLLRSAPAWHAEALREILAAADESPAGSCRWLTVDEIRSLSSACSAVDWDAADSDLEREHLYERFLAMHVASERRRKGVFFTPRPIVRFMLAQVDWQLREEFDRADGIAAADVQLLDPAAGTGTFLYEAVTLIHERFCESAERDWNAYVVERLLPQLTGIELMPTSCFLAGLHIAGRLGRTGFDFRCPGPVRVELGNALSGPSGVEQGRVGSCVVVIGNPPFSYLSENDSPWIKGLIRGDGGERGYLDFDGERLGERKTWLHDDYVKFLRYAQWRVEAAGSGIVAFVTNHGYLDNATFRILRRQWMRTFPRISVVDLHGNRKKHEVSPDGGRDDNVFGLDQGVAIGLFRTAAAGAGEATVEHAELWGGRHAKLTALELWADSPHSSHGHQTVLPAAPDYRWKPQSASPHPEYSRGIRLPEAMPVYTTAPVTARDGLVVAFTPEELLRRMERFCDLSISDEQIRRELFPRSRTARYPAGDTRGWKLAEARRRLATEAHLESFVRRCLYRPFDWRFVFWHEAMVDWPRAEVMRHLLDGPAAAVDSGDGNVALIARRQMLPSQPCTYFWVTDGLTLDGVIRSDNRGSEAVFPQWLLERIDQPAKLNLSSNLSSFPRSAWERTHRRSASSAPSADHGTQSVRTCVPTQSVGTRDADDGGSGFVEYAYALFHAPGYRTRYADDLRRDFPRVMLPREPSLQRSLAGLGRRLIDWHLLRDSAVAAAETIGPACEDGCLVASAFPCFEGGQVFAQPSLAIAACSPAAWEFRAGGHQALRKWLADRRGRKLGPEDMQHYRRIVAAVEQTLAALPAIEAAVEDQGGWRHAFQ